VVRLKIPVIAFLGYLYQGDYSIPIKLADELKAKGLDVLDLSLGAMKAADILRILSPNKLIILTADKKGKKELRIYKPDDIENKISTWIDVISSMSAYYMDINSFLKVAKSLDVLPEDTTIIECEVELDEGIELSEWGKECLELMKKKIIEYFRGYSTFSQG
jgi:Ni,Fe-hydrogenase maturation factor